MPKFDAFHNVDDELLERLFIKHGGWAADEGWVLNRSGLQDFLRDLCAATNPPRWIPATERLPEERERPYQVIVACVKQHDADSMYGGKGVRRFQQDWVVRRWPQNFTHWMEAMPWPQ